MAERKVLAVDFGASSGRGMLGEYDGQRIRVKELHRFANDPVVVNGTMYWDVLRLFHEIKQGILKSKEYGTAESIGVDTWGVDFGLLDGQGYLLDNPVHYRDGRTQGMVEKSFAKIPQEDFYQLTGIQFMEINTVFQLMALKEQRPELLARAESMLMMPDLFNYFLSGVKASERSIVSTTQMGDPQQCGWVEEVVAKLELPRRILGEVVPTGTVIGKLQTAIQEELSVGELAVVAVAGHDTQCAMAAVPAQTEDFIFLSSGTWSLLGTELAEPVVTKQSAKLNLTNETGMAGKTSFLKNIIGLWLIQESRRQWLKEGKEYSFAQLEDIAEAAEPFQCLIDPDAPVFAPAGNMPERIRAYCRETGQKVPQSEGEIVRCINESLALKYRYVMEEIKACTGKEYEAIHVVGGGVKSELLCRFTAHACGTRVVAGPAEATVYGNMVIQLMAGGAIADLKQARQVVAASETPLVYEPGDRDAWEQAYAGYVKDILPERNNN